MSTKNGISIKDKLDHGPPIKQRERVIYFEGPSKKRGDISIREMSDGTMQVQLFNLAAGTTVICPEDHYRPTTNTKSKSKNDGND